ncbi:cytochrome c peroxidase [Stella humosa]|uniref:Cytochrome c peroxidase n=1 Tax=Stella humosa TaxID=94 RepID=A0A3N1M7I3_9PROT|nr:cytochrome c peroxidase [Stella humosa]ROP99657.1 cytochrome c peroxidase [Stella humosa]BBK31118.1 di-heme enzyme [Stella humosa]
MRRPGWLAAILLVAAALLADAAAAELTPAETARILRHGPWPLAWRPDPGNRLSGKAEAVELGRALFFDSRISPDGTVACATCHRPDRAWTDGRPASRGLADHDRNAPSLLDVRLWRWFGWDGASDSLWAASLRPMLEPGEMGGSVAALARLVREDAGLRAQYRTATGDAPATDDMAVAVDAAKALAAFQETLVGGRSPFDRFRDGLASGDRAAVAGYPADALRGLRLFVGRGNCSVCHLGPAFTSSEFEDVGVGYFLGRGKADAGRIAGIDRLRASPFNRLGPWSDGGGADAAATRHVAAQHRDFGLFRVPSLRNVAASAPYMHHGRLASLEAVVRHYSEVDEERLHVDGARLVRPLRLSEGEAADLVAFLRSLTSEP